MMELVLPPLAMVTLEALAVQVGWRYRARHSPHYLLWGLALLLLAVGGGCRFVGEWVGWSALLYRLWYLTASLLPVAYLGQGAVYLLAERRAAHLTFLLLLLSTVVAVWAVLRVPIEPTPQVLRAGLATWAEITPPMLHGLVLAFHFFGVLTLSAAVWQPIWYRWRRGPTSVPGLTSSLGALLLLLGAVAASFGGRMESASRLLPAMGQVAGAGLICLGGALIGRPPRIDPAAIAENQVRRLRQRRRRHVRQLSKRLRR